MNLGRWDSAVFKSVFLTAFFVLLYAIYEIGFPNDFDSLAGFGMSTMLFMGGICYFRWLAGC